MQQYENTIYYKTLVPSITPKQSIHLNGDFTCLTSNPHAKYCLTINSRPTVATLFLKHHQVASNTPALCHCDAFSKAVTAQVMATTSGFNLKEKWRLLNEDFNSKKNLINDG